MQWQAALSAAVPSDHHDRSYSLANGSIVMNLILLERLRFLSRRITAFLWNAGPGTSKAGSGPPGRRAGAGQTQLSLSVQVLFE